MKLLHKNILINALVSLIVIFLGGIISYFFIIGKIEQEAEEHLRGEKNQVENRILAGMPPETFEHNVGDQVKVEEISRLSGRKPFIKIITQREEFEEQEEKEEEEEHFETRAIVFECSTPEKNYRITIIKSSDNDEELIKNILLAVSISALLMIIAIVMANVFIYKNLWSPFYAILKQLNQYDISRGENVKFTKAETLEFRELASSLDAMAAKIAQDYFSLKEFTENASHEIQTPLAIINSKIEMCLQDKQLTSNQAKLLIEASRAANNLVNLNKGLIMLTRLDNKQVEASSTVNLKEFIADRLLLFEDFIQEKEISLTVKTESQSVHMNPELAGILFDNLIKNAIRHNSQRGVMNIDISNHRFIISNTGAAPSVNPEKFFERFSKNGPADSLGLGLAIVKKICEVYHFTISYTFRERMHTITIDLGETDPSV